jgi:hypothetical protein
MDDPNQLQQAMEVHGSGAMSVNWVSWLLGIVVLLLSAIGEVYRRRVDEHEKSHVTREELAAIVNQNKTDSDAKHTENTIRLERIEDRVNALPSVATTVRIEKTSPRKRRRRK